MKYAKVAVFSLFFLSGQNILADSADLFGALAEGHESYKYADRDMTDVVVGGAKAGLARGINKSISNFVEKIFGPIIRQGAYVFRVGNRALMRSLKGQNGFDVREPVSYNHILKRDIDTINNTAKGARVVRAHILEQDSHASSDIKNIPYSVLVLKADAEFIIKMLEMRVKYYQQTIQARDVKIGTKLLDGLAIGGMAGVWGASWFVKGLSRKKLESKLDKSFGKLCSYNKTMEESRGGGNKIFIQVPQNASLEAKQMGDFIDKNVRPYIEKEGQGAPISEGAQKIFNEIDKEAQSDVLAFQKHKEQNIENRMFVAKCMVTSFALWRAYEWFRSGRAASSAEMLSDIDREMVVHVTHNIIDQLKHLVVLCDEIKEESDVAKFKDDFEFTSKNCSEALMHLAQLIDQEEAIRLQGLGKPGQSLGLNPKGGMPSIYPQ